MIEINQAINGLASRVKRAKLFYILYRIVWTHLKCQSTSEFKGVKKDILGKYK